MMMSVILSGKMEKAEAGDVHAMYYVARAYRDGEGCDADPAAELKWLMRAADNGHPQALLDMAFRYAFGTGVPTNVEKERDCYEKIIAGECKGFPGTEYTQGVAKLSLGLSIFDQKKARDYARAGQLIREAVELHGYKPARNEYAICLLLGLGLEHDKTRGMELLQQSADAGNSIAREMLQKRILRGHAQITAAGLEPLWDAGKRPYYPIADLFKAPGQQERVTPPVTEMKSAPAVPVAKTAGNKNTAGQAGYFSHDIPPTPPRPMIGAAEAQEQLDALIGLAGAKQQVKTLLNRQRLDGLRRAQGLPATEMTLHLVFTGNPGTGKTTVARLLGAILHDAGLLEKGHVIEVSNHDLIGEWVGTSSPRVAAKVKEAMGGILFIDEAYNLMAAVGSGGPSGSFSMAAITTLVQEMENNKGKFMVIAAGYPKEMQEFVDFNPGLQSRFRETIHFDDFTDEELAEVFVGFADQNKYTLAAGARETLLKIMHDAPARHAKTFGNARYVRNLFEETLERVANRLAPVASPTLSDLTTITAFDIKSAAEDFARQDMLRKRQQY